MSIIEKADKLLSGLSDEKVTVIDIDKYLNQKGVLVNVHVHKTGLTRTLPLSAFGVDVNKNEELADFSKKHLRAGKLSFIDAEHAKVFSKIESGIRAKQKELAIGFNDKYMTIDTFKEFKSFLDEKKDLFNKNVEEVASNWDELQQKFVIELDKALDDMNALDKDKIRDKIISKIPTKQGFIESCSIEAELSIFPSQENVDVFSSALSDDIKDSIAKRNLKLVYEVLSRVLSDSFSTLNNILKYFKDNKTITKTQRNSLEGLIKRIKSKNLFKNPAIDKIVSLLTEAYDESDVGDCIELIEDVQTFTYMFARDIDIATALDLENSILSEETLQISATGIEKFGYE